MSEQPVVLGSGDQNAARLASVIESLQNSTDDKSAA